jgi:hypothetical protein
MAIDHTATTAYAGIRYAPRPNTRTCAQGSPAQQRFISDLTRDIYATRVAQARLTPVPDSGRWTQADVDALVSGLGTAEDAVTRQMAAPLVYSGPDRVGTIDALKATVQRERKLLAAMSARASKDAPTATLAGPAELQEDKTYRAPDGRIFRVVRGSSGYLYGKLYVSTGHREGYWDYFQGIRRVEGLQLLTLDEAQAFGQLTGQCSECQTPLKDPVSIVLGIGPICEQNFTGKARSRGKAFRASVLARATADQLAQMRPEDRPGPDVDASEPAPF